MDLKWIAQSRALIVGCQLTSEPLRSQYRMAITMSMTSSRLTRMMP